MEIVDYFALPTQSFTIYTTTGAAVKDTNHMSLINNAALLGVNTLLASLTLKAWVPLTGPSRIEQPVRCQNKGDRSTQIHPS